jgi:glucokinase
MKLLVADCGGTRIKLGLVENRTLCEQSAIDSGSDQPLDGRLTTMVQVLETMCGDRGWRMRDCRGLLLALPAIVSPDQGSVTATFGKFDDAHGFDFKAWAVERLGLPVLLENDARAAALGEWTCGAGRGCGNMVMVTLGTGIGTAVICEGSPLRGRSGMAGNLGGHTATHVGGSTCRCGLDGCLEAQVATWALPTLIRNHPEYAGNPLAEEAVLDYEAVFRHADAGNPLAMEFKDRALRAWGALMVNLVHSYDPERIVMGGGIMKQQQVILSAMRGMVDRQATLPGGPVEIVAASLGDAAALMGGPWLFEQEETNVRKDCAI